MKSRKIGLFGKRTTTRAKSARKHNTLRKGLVETLEKRELLAADLTPYSDGLYYPAVGVHTGDYITGLNIGEYTRRAWETGAFGNSSGGLYGEGADATTGSATSVSEVEPNNSFSTSQFLPLGTANGQFPIVNVVGQVNAFPQGGQSFDEDWYRMNLQGGDIIDVRLVGGLSQGPNPLQPFDVTLLNANRTEIAGRTSPVGLGAYPTLSPLSSDGSVSFAYVIPSDGTYYIKVADGDATYALGLKTFRPTLEKEPVGTKQIVYVDFDGARVRTDIFGLPLGSVRLSPITNFFQAAGLQSTDEVPLIRSILAKIQENFQGTVPLLATNGYYAQDGVPGNFDITFLNSLDHPGFDPDSNPNVTKLIISGSLTEFPLPVRGIADSVDVGNFATAGTVIVLPDVYMSPMILGQPNLDFVGQYPVSPGVPVLEAYATAIAATASHELGHTFGAWHQDNSNAIISQMDSGGLPIPATRLGVGPDGIFGTADDIDIDFGIDAYAPGEGNIGFEDTAAAMAYGLSTGTSGGARVTGRVFNDRNRNGALDSSDTAGPQAMVWADSDRDGVFDPGEFFTIADAAGNYNLLLPAGSHHIRAEVKPGWKATNSSTADVSLSVGQSIVRNFGFEQLNLSFTGIKWNDANANGIRDTNEVGIAGVWIYIDLDGDNRIDIGEPSTQTRADGTYTLSFPGAGTYALREVVDAGYVQTFPPAANDNEHIVTLTGDPTIDINRTAGLNFGNTLTVDFGDAPASFGIASHGFVPGLRLGNNWDAEQSSQFSLNALGDDNNGATDAGGVLIDDEDGITLARPLVRGSTNNRVSVVANNGTGAPGYLNAWIDFNQNGAFEANERILTNEIVGSGTSNLTFTAPTTAALGNAFARFRYSNELNVGPTGATGTGEVEDYLFSVVATLEIAVDDRATVSRNSVLNEIDVLANDFQLPGETLNIVSTSSTTAGGIATISTNNRILYTPPSGFIGQDSFTYTVRNSGGDIDTANVIVDVNLSFANPLAIDDSFEVATNAIDFPLNVLANDVEGQNGALSIIMVTQPDKGGAISIATGGKSLRYTPARSFGGTEFFTYTVADAAGNRSTAQVTLHTLPGDRSDDDVQIQLVARDLNGNAITAIPQGQRFVIDVLVDDLRFSSANPGSAAGVFSAFTDLLYNLQLVSTAPGQPGGRFNFDVSFFNGYTNGQTGDASIPGVIDEFGAFFDGLTLNQPDPVRMASITFEARSPGIARFMADPADQVPASDTLLFDTPSTAVPKERIRYLGTSVEIVGDGAQFPVAVDDSVPQLIPAGSINFPIDVLANDRPGSTGSISIVAFDATTTNGGRVSINAAGNRLLYTPRSDFNGADQFTYTIQDTRGIQSVATVTVRVGNANANDVVNFRLQATDLSGTPIDQVTLGSQFQLRGYVQDLRTSGQSLGIFAAYEDILYSSTLVSPVASSTNDPNLGFQVSFGPNYQRVREGDIRTPGIINEIGAVSTVDTPLGNAEQLLFVVTMVANARGTASFIADPADIKPLHDTLTYEPVMPVSVDQMRFGFDSLEIVTGGTSGNAEGFHNASNALDVNDDGFISPIDALSIINLLNSGDSGVLGGSGEGETGTKMYIDTNDDGYLSPVDALLVINFLNSSASGEGEASPGAVLASYMSAGGLAQSATGIQAETSAKDADSGISSPTSSIAPTMTANSYGPSNDELDRATDQLFDTDDSSMDELLEQLAPSIEENWKKRV